MVHLKADNGLKYQTSIGDGHVGVNISKQVIHI